MTLHEFNILTREQLEKELFKCCGSKLWVEKMLPFIPAEDMVELLEDAEEQWWQCSESDWKEAFAQHPRIGDRKISWASSEQSGMTKASEETINAFIEANKAYEEKFGYIFIVCASGKSAEEMLGMLQSRLQHDAADEIMIAADEQNKITKLRIEKLLE
jgi:2-oxo-4-hydroxy-4-carboxy-5-ureidoimidazoline decarboxylase